MTTSEFTKKISNLTGRTDYFYNIADVIGNPEFEVIFYENTTDAEYSLREMNTNSNLYSNECTVLQISNRLDNGAVCEDTVFITIEFTGNVREW